MKKVTLFDSQYNNINTNIIILTLIDICISQTVVNFDRPAEALRAAVFHGANQFHLFVLSLPGQVLLDHCNELAKQMYVFTIFTQVQATDEKNDESSHLNSGLIIYIIIAILTINTKLVSLSILLILILILIKLNYSKNQNSILFTFYITFIYINVFFIHF